MIRRRFAVEENALARAVAARRARGAPILDLTASNPTAVGLPYPEEAIRAALADPRLFSYEPTPAGLSAAREAVARYCRDHGARVEPDDVLLAASTSEAYGWCLSLLCEPGDEVLVPAPSYPVLETIAALARVSLRPYPLVFDGESFHLDPGALEAAIGPRTRAVVAVHPGSPTGRFLRRGEAAALLAACARRGLALVADEVFLDAGLVEPPDRAPTFAGAGGPLVIALSGLSKVCALPQLKCAWLVVSGEGAREARAELEAIADAFLSVATPVQLALPALLARRGPVQEALRSVVRERRAALAAARDRDAAWDLLPAEAGWHALLRVPRTMSDEAWALALLERGLLVQPGFFHDLPHEGFLVLGLLLPAGDAARAFEALSGALR